MIEINTMTAAVCFAGAVVYMILAIAFVLAWLEKRSRINREREAVNFGYARYICQGNKHNLFVWKAVEDEGENISDD